MHVRMARLSDVHVLSFSLLPLCLFLRVQVASELVGKFRKRVCN
jgi:hypothetical protein